MFNLSKYENLPETVEVEELRNLFTEVLNFAQRQDISIESILVALNELADRQWHTYEILDKTIKDRLERWIIDTATPEIDLDTSEKLTLLTGYLGLSKALEHFSQIAPLIKNLNVQKEFYEAIEELRPNIDDPYSGMPDI